MLVDFEIHAKLVEPKHDPPQSQLHELHAPAQVSHRQSFAKKKKAKIDPLATAIWQRQESHRLQALTHCHAAQPTVQNSTQQ
jgi:hypothetical protein